MSSFTPSYIRAFRDGRLQEKAQIARKRLEACDLCPRNCGANRLSGETGACGTGDLAMVSSYDAHFGEERPLVGTGGSGTIFFTWCNLGCNFCQNWEISHQGDGTAVTPEILSDTMIYLQRMGCHNINFVTPSHVVPQILSALEIAADKGLYLPLVYNTSGYDRLDTIQLLEGIIDIYMPDFKFWDPRVAEMTCQAADYPECARMAIGEMYRQVGDLQTDSQGIAWKGLLIRHLVMPNNLAGTKAVMAFIAGTLSTTTYVNIMPQYRPCGTARTVKGLARHITDQEFADALEAAKNQGLTRLDPPSPLFRL